MCIFILINQNKIVYISMYTLIHMPYTLTHNTLTYSFNKSTTHCLIIYMLIFFNSVLILCTGILRKVSLLWKFLPFKTPRKKSIRALDY